MLLNYQSWINKTGANAPPLQQNHNKQNLISIPEYFAGQSIFITGGTGLMGKVLIEKILRSCPDVDQVYLLIRPKNNEAIEERWSKITNLPLFDRLKAERPDALNKVVLIPGDIKDEYLCPEEYRKLLQKNVTMIYHAAAVIQFTDSVRDALIQNVRSTAAMLDMAKGMSKLQVFVYVSTTYSNINKPCPEVEEKVLPSFYDWKVLLKLLKTEPHTLSLLKEKLLCGHPNLYTFSKSIAEQVVNEYQQHFPVIIVRPSFVFCAIEEPLPGWNDGTNVCFAFFSAVSLGLLHVIKFSLDDFQDMIPVDIAIKAFLIAPWKLHITGEQQTTEVYNCASAMDVQITYRDLKNQALPLLERYPSQYVLCTPFAFNTKNRMLHSILFFFLQILPATILDLLLRFLKKEPMFNKLNRKLMNGYRLGDPVMKRRIAFPNQRFKELPMHLKDEDRGAFSYSTSLENISKVDIIKFQYLGFHKYFLKEDMSEDQLMKNKKRYQRIKLITNTLLATFLAIGVIIISDFFLP